jgi:hypothetical protein
VETLGRAIGLDVHLEFCEVAIVEAGALRSAGRTFSTRRLSSALAIRGA